MRRRTSSRPRHTVPMPPRPISASSVYLPAITLRPSLQLTVRSTHGTGSHVRRPMGEDCDRAHRFPFDRAQPAGRPRVARPRRALDGPRRPARGPDRGERPVLRGLRPDRAQPAHGQPGADRHRHAAPAGRAHAVRPGRRRDRHDRRPEGLRRAGAQLRRDGQGLGGAGPAPDRAVPVVRGRQRRHDGQQPRLDREPLDDRLPARHRQALPGEPDARPRRRALPARGGHQLHRVLLRALAVDGLPQPLPRARRGAAVRRLRPVGQPHGRRRADPAGRRRPRARVRDTADHEGRRHQVRQDRERCALARPRDDVAVRLLPVLAQPGRRRGR